VFLPGDDSTAGVAVVTTETWILRRKLELPAFGYLPFFKP
jgi:hypothetical protein